MGKYNKELLLQNTSEWKGFSPLPKYEFSGEGDKVRVFRIKFANLKGFWFDGVNNG